MRVSVSVLVIGLGIALALPAFSEGETWEPSTLSPATLDRVRSALEVYQRCVNRETQAHLGDRQDPRRVTDVILKACENDLSAVKTPFDAEKVPAEISERYLRSKRSLAAQQIVRVVMATQAVRSADEKASP